MPAGSKDVGEERTVILSGTKPVELLDAYAEKIKSGKLPVNWEELTVVYVDSDGKETALHGNTSFTDWFASIGPMTKLRTALEGARSVPIPDATEAAASRGADLSCGN